MSITADQLAQRRTAYSEWIASYLERNRSTLGKCHSATSEMMTEFPELQLVKGHVYCPFGKRGHVWLKDPDGKVVDPTASQFGMVFDYEPWEPGMEVRVGRCMECGVDIWRAVDTLDEDHSDCICSKECEAMFAAQF